MSVCVCCVFLNVFILNCNQTHTFSVGYRRVSQAINRADNSSPNFPYFPYKVCGILYGCDGDDTEFAKCLRVCMCHRTKSIRNERKKKSKIIFLIYLANKFNQVSVGTRCIETLLLSFAWFRLIFYYIRS